MSPGARLVHSRYPVGSVPEVLRNSPTGFSHHRYRVGA